MPKELLYTIKDYYETKNKTGLVISLFARDERGEYHSIKAYAPYYSLFEGSATSEKLGNVNGQKVARIVIPTERKFIK